MNARSRPPPRRARHGAAALLLVAPLGVLLLLFFLPLARVFAISVGGDRLSPASYARMLESTAYFDALLWTFELALGTSLLCLVIGYPIAYALSIVGRRLRLMIFACMIVPFWTSALVRAFAWIGVLGRKGLVNDALLASGLVDAPLSLVFNATGVYIGTVHIMLPYMVLTLYAAMSRIDLTLLRAAGTLGAGRPRAFMLVYVPQTMPGIVSGFLIVFILSLGFFITPAVLGGPRSQSFIVLVDRYMNELIDWQFASALSVVLLLSTLALYLPFARYVGVNAGRANPGRSGSVAAHLLMSAADRTLAPVRRLLSSALGAMSISARRCEHCLVVAYAAIVSLLVALPIALVVLLAFSTSYTVRIPPSSLSLAWFEMYFSRREWVEATSTSFQVASVAAVIGTALAIFAALALRRLPQRQQAWLFAVFITPMIFPTIVYGVALYFLFVPYRLVDTKLGLILSYIVLALPPALLMVFAAAQLLDDRLEDAAASLGATAWQRFRLIILPLWAPAIGAGGLAAFLTVFDDLNIALFLTGGDTMTLPKKMYDSIRHENDPRATAASAVLVGLTLVVVVAIHLARHRPLSRRLRTSPRSPH